MNSFGEAAVVDPLSDREAEILSLLAEGLSNREISQKLFLSLETIKWYNKQLYSKLGVHSRSQAVAMAREHDLLEGSIKTKSRPMVRLPLQLTSFVGRKREIAEVQQLLKSSRLVTLTGSGGTGKTRLSLCVAELVVGDYADGVLFVTLATANDARQVQKAIAQVLGIVERPKQSLVESIQSYLSNKQLLLVLDNFEHVLAAASLVTELLTAAPGLIIMTTSRETLRLSGEHEFHVPPLVLPDPAHMEGASDLLAAESVTLFVQRARASSANFYMTNENAPAIASICLRLDGLPLAIELAAARIKLFSPQQMLERLQSRLGLLVGGPRDLPDRQRTLRDTIGWSYNLLDDAEQLLFARLAVFSGGRTIEAVEAICGFGLVSNPLKGLSSLLDKSLLYKGEGPGGEPRFYMLETIQEYASEWLSAGGEKHQIQERHHEYFLSLAEEMEPGYGQQGQVLLLAQTEVEWGNLRSAFNWALENGNEEGAARLISAVNYFLRYKSRVIEGYRMSKRVLDKKGQIRQQYWIRFLIAAGHLAHNSGELEQGVLFAQQALTLAQERGDKRNEAWSLISIVLAIDLPEEYEKALKLGNESLIIFRELDDNVGINFALNTLGIIAKLARNFEQAKEVLEEGLLLSQETGEVYRQSLILDNLAAIAYMEGDYQEAKDLAISFTKIRFEVDWWEYASIGLAGIAGPLAQLGEPEKAARLLGASAGVLTGMGIDYQSTQRPEILAYIVDVKSQLDESTFATAWEEGQLMTYEQALDYALGE